MRSAFDEFRSHLVTVGRIDQMCSAFGQTCSAIGQMRARLAKRACNLPNVVHLVKCHAFDQLVKCAAHLPKCADWSNASYITTCTLHYRLLLHIKYHFRRTFSHNMYGILLFAIKATIQYVQQCNNTTYNTHKHKN